MRLTDNTDLSAYVISIVISPGKFSITDNCGGMTINEAQNYAFSFGRSDSMPGDDYSIGVYGIGMKRAAFKLCQGRRENRPHGVDGQDKCPAK